MISLSTLRMPSSVSRTAGGIAKTDGRDDAGHGPMPKKNTAGIR